jgi:Protein of unknown function (DUF4235)
MNGRKIAFKPVALIAGAVGSALFNAAWRKADKGREVPHPEDATRKWGEVIAAAALQGAVFAVIHAIVDRAAAVPRAGSKAEQRQALHSVGD